MFPGLLAERHKVFISYHHADEWAVKQFIARFDHATDALISRGLGAGMPGELINSQDDAYIMRRIREEYLRDSTITIVMLGECTWARMFVDWEIQASLRPTSAGGLPNGLIAFRLPTNPVPEVPDRLKLNLRSPHVPGHYNLSPDRYARYYDLPQDERTLRAYIEEAFWARTSRAQLLVNPQERLSDDCDCGHPWHRSVHPRGVL